MAVNVSIGDRFGRLLVIAEAEKIASGIKEVRYRRAVSCKCDCGNTHVVAVGALQFGQTTSCGCYKKEQQKKSQRKNAKTICMDQSHPLKSVWWSMHVRCYNKKNKRWHRYGGRGIAVCERWNSFENFLEDMPPRPSKKHSIDREDNNGNYEPGNCKWSTQKEQGSNTSKTRFIEYKNETMSITQLAEKVGMKVATLWARLKKGMSVSEAVETPIRRKASS